VTPWRLTSFTDGGDPVYIADPDRRFEALID
jgi:hypothetical protein